MNMLRKMIAALEGQRTRDRKWLRMLTVCAAIVIFATTYALVLPALTLDNKTADDLDGLSLAAAEQSGSAAITDSAFDSGLAEQNEDALAINGGNGGSGVEKTSEKTAVSPSGDTKPVISLVSGEPDETSGEVKPSEKKEDQDKAGSDNGKSDADKSDKNDESEGSGKSDAGTETLEADCDSCRVTVTYSEDAGIPDGAKLKVSEIKEGTAEYTHYYKASREALDTKRPLSSARFFDVTITDADGKEIEPKAEVRTEIRYDESIEVTGEQRMRVVHFAEEDGKEKPEVLDPATTKDKDEKNRVSAVSFRQESFSVIATAVEPLESGWPAETDKRGYVMVVTAGDGDYYAVDQNGSLTPVSVRGIDTSSPYVVFDQAGHSDDKIADIENQYYWYLDAYAGEGHSGEYQIGNRTLTKYIQPYNSSGMTGNTSWFMYRTSSGQIYHYYEGRYYLGIDKATMKLKGHGQRKSGNVAVSADACAVYFIHDLSNPDDPDDNDAESGDDTVDVGQPEASKTLTPHNATAADPDGDGTYDLSLSVTGKTKSMNEAGKADITIIYDNSYSMVENHVSATDQTQRLTVARDAIDTMAESLLEPNKKNPDSVRLSLVTFGNTAEINTFGGSDSTNDLKTFKNTVDSITEDTVKSHIGELKNLQGTVYGVATNWEDALEKAYDVETRSDAKHYVILVSDGNPTVRNTAGYYYGSYINDSPYSIGHGVGYTGPLDIYGTGCEVSSTVYYYTGNNSYAQNVVSGTDNMDRCYWESRDNARALVRKGTSFYTVSAFGNIGRMHQLLDYAYNNTDQVSTKTPSGHYYTASDRTSLNDAFRNIVNQIMVDYSYADVHVTDEITGMTMLDAKSSDVTLNEPQFRYYRYGGKYGGSAENPVEMTDEEREAAGIGDARYENGKVIWDVAEARQTVNGKLQRKETPELEDGVTYVVKFRVWPDQEAYDKMVAVRNADDPDAAYAQLSDDVKKQIYKDKNGVYRLRTNGKASVSYDTIKQTLVTPDDGSTGVELVDNDKTFDLDNPEGMPLMVDRLEVQKVWEDGGMSNDSRSSVAFDIYANGTKIGEITLTKDDVSPDNPNVWRKYIYISPGLKVSSPSATTLNSGYTYTIKERGLATSYTFTSTSSHPYLVDSPHEIKEGNGGTSILTGTNTLNYNVRILKKSEKGGIVLKGAEFALYSDSACTKPVKDGEGNAITVTTGDDGIAEIGALAPGGTYYLKETKAPQGYLKIEGAIKITVGSDGKIKYYLPEGAPGAGKIDNEGSGTGSGVTLECDNGTLTGTITILDATAAGMPDTGGRGTLPFIIGGIALIVIAAAAYAVKKHKK
jgi:LPXTG-motif cell wall-anchored protein